MTLTSNTVKTYSSVTSFVVSLVLISGLVTSGCAQRSPSSSNQADAVSYEPIFVDTLEHRHGQYRHSHSGGDQVHSHPTRRRPNNQQGDAPITDLKKKGAFEQPSILPSSPKVL